MFLRVNNVGGVVQSVTTGADQKVVLANVVFDTLSGWSAATNEYTVPASLDGAKIVLFGATKRDGALRSSMEIGFRINAGLPVYATFNNTNCMQFTSGVFEVATGDTFFLAAGSSSGYDLSTDAFTFLSGYKVA